jgi:hypothetical protein
VTRLRSRSYFGLALLAVLVVGLFAGAWALLGNGGRASQPPAARPDRPALLLLTSLPLMFGEQFTLDQVGSKALDALESRFSVVPIAVAEPQQLRGGPLLLMAHAHAQPAEALVALDAWVRQGGRLLLLADPALEWHSDRPLGDRLRPSPMFPDTGLLAHWGLRLQAPPDGGPAERQLAGHPILTVSPGTLSGKCEIGPAGFVADCRIGSGRVTIVADADFLNVDSLDGPTDRNLDALVEALGRLAS